MLDEVKALTFDVFGTVVDWRGSVIREGERLARETGLSADWAAFADAWRGRYQPGMEAVRSGARPWVNLDQLHRESLEQIIPEFGLDALDEAGRAHLTRVWHRLDPWPDSVKGLTRLKRRFILATLSNGHVALMVNLARQAGLPWDAVLGAEVAQGYKPQPHVYLTAARLLGLQPHECMMVAAHPYDLRAARALGFRTAYIHRPLEFGPGPEPERPAPDEFDAAAESMTELADQLGA